MDPLVIGAILSLIGTVLGIGATAVENHKNREQNEELQEKQNDFNSIEAEKANEREISNYLNYESPAAKLQQTKQAGLSPSVMYAGNGISGALRSAPQATAASVSPYYSNNQMGMLFSQLGTNLGDTVKSLAGAKNDIADIEKKKNEIKKLNAETDKIFEEIKQTKNETALAGWKYAKTMTISYSQLQSWSNGETTSWNQATGESQNDSFGLNGGIGVDVFKKLPDIKEKGKTTTGDQNKNDLKIDLGGSDSHGSSYNESAGTSYQRADAESLQQSGSASVMLLPRIENGEIKGINCYILSSDFDENILQEFNERKEKKEEKGTRNKAKGDQNNWQLRTDVKHQKLSYDDIERK